MHKFIYLLFLLALRHADGRMLPLHFEPLAQPGAGYLGRGADDQIVFRPDRIQVIRPAGHPVDLRFVGASRRPRIEPLDPLDARTSYLLGNDRRLWKTGVPNYSRLRYRELYRGVDAEFYARGNEFEYDLIVRPGADPSRIRLAFDGARGVNIDSEGDLVVGALRQRRPVAYQDIGGRRREVPARYVKRADGTIGFALGTYDPRAVLVIDPALVFFNSVSGALGSKVAVDPAGNIYMAGQATSIDFPVTAGAFQTGYLAGQLCATAGEAIAAHTCRDMFVTKWDPTGTRLLWATLIGGHRDDSVAAMVVDAAGNVYLAGTTTSSDFPVTAGAFQTTYGGPVNTFSLSGDAVVVKLDPTGSALQYATYLGGEQEDAATGLAIDADGNAYLCGSTYSTAFPTTDGAFQRHLGGGTAGLHSNAFAARLDAQGQHLAYSTYLGGGGLDQATALALDGARGVYVAGSTGSADFPTTPGVYQAVPPRPPVSFPFVTGAFVAHLDAGGALTASTFFNGGGERDITALAWSNGGLYLGGYLDYDDLPVTPDALQKRIPGTCAYSVENTIVQCYDGFVARLDAGLSQVTYATYLGGSQNDWILSMALDAQGRLAIAGSTMSPDFPVTAESFQPCYRGPYFTGNGFIARFQPGAPLEYSTYLGGTYGASVAGVAVAGERVYLAGNAGFQDYPPPATPSLAAGALPSTVLTAFLASLDFGVSLPPSRVACVMNGGSLLGGAVAPGEIVQIAGAGLGPDQAVTAQPNEAGLFPFTLGGVQVRVNQAIAPLLSVQNNRILAIVPFGVAGSGTAQFVVYNQDTPVSPYVVSVADTSPGILSLDGSGHAPWAVLNQDGSLNSTANPAARGSQVSIYTTGLGQTTPPLADGVLNSSGGRLAGTVWVSIGFYTSEVLFAGPAPGAVAGTYQVNARVPFQSPAGNEIPVLLGVTGQNITTSSQAQATIAVR